MDASTPFLKAALSARLIAVFLATGMCLSGCESQTEAQNVTKVEPSDQMAAFIQYIKDIKVEDEDDGAAASAPPAQTKTLAHTEGEPTGYMDYWRQGAQIALDTGKDIAMSDDGLISVSPKFEIKLITANEARAQYVAPTALDVTPHADESVAPTPISASESAPRSVPSLPIGLEQGLERQAPEPALEKSSQKPPAKAALKLSDKSPVNGRLIQVGAFSTLEAAQGAMVLMLNNRPDLAGLRPHLETVITPQGKRVRLKLGPVKDQATAERLCQSLSADNPSWCVKAG